VAGISIIVLYAIYKIKSGVMDVGMIAVLFQYANRFYSPIKNITQYYQTIQAGIVSAKRINDFFDLHNEENKAVNMPNEEYTKKEKIVFNNVSLDINNQPIINNFNLECSKGDLVLIKGHSGCGKTSLLRIILGFYPVENKKVYIYGRDINSFDKHTLREKLAYASQHVFLHNDSILNNVIYPEKQHCKKRDEITEILDGLNLSKKNIYEATGEEGKNLSGGERSRIAFARALIRDADIMVLDEITAGLDKENEDLIIETLSQIKGEKTIFFVSHSNNQRLFEIADAVVEIKKKCEEDQREAI
jgi:ABC-type multidrug transport system fused ATPase/permease subunit